MRFFYFLSFLYFFGSSFVLGQNFFDNIKYGVESGIYISTSGKTPFLMRSNQYGTVPLENPIFTISGTVSKDYDSTYSDSRRLNRVAVGYGINAVANAGKINRVLLPEAYFKVRYGAFEFYGGRRKEIVGLVDTVLTSGSYIWSGNALPIPKIQISIPNYTSVMGKGLISIKGAYSHGWFNNGVVKNYYLHQKYLYIKVGKPNWKLKLYSGFNHQAQWGGKPSQPYLDKETGILISKFPSDFSTYTKVVSGMSLNKSDDGLDTNLPRNEALNRAGNHLGTIDIGVEAAFKNFDLFIYRQSIYEDGSLFYLNNISDGLLGISFKRKFVNRGINRICFEYLDTKSQGGTGSSLSPIGQLRGKDNYFNNEIYADGWTYLNNTIGTPLIVPLGSINQEGISKNLQKELPTYLLNRVRAFSFSIGGQAKNLSYYTKVILNTNSGTYYNIIDRKQFSFLYNLKYKLPKFSLVSSIAFDEGSLFTTSLSGYLGVQRTFF